MSWFSNKFGTRRRAGAVVTTAVTLPVLIGFAAITVDVGYIYNARTDLQCAADAAALAAAAALSEPGATTSSSEALQRARDEANRFMNMNAVLGRRMVLEFDDVEFGRSYQNDQTGLYTFTKTNELPDSVRVRVGFSKESPNGQLSLFFAGIFGRAATDVSASATATVAPRDIAIVADLSASHSDDSELRNYELTAINMHQAWDALPGGADEVGGGLWDLGAIPPAWVEPDGSVPQAAGPGWGYFQNLGFGDLVLDSSYDPTTDPGLIRLAYNVNWTDADLRASLTARSYSNAEVNAIMNRNFDASGAYEFRTAVALGLAEWNSGMAGGRWSVMGLPSAGNNNANVQSGEVSFTQTIFGNNLTDSRSIWRDYINDYMRDTSSAMYDANSAFRYRFGIKTFINYLLEERSTNSETPEFASIPQQPMQAVKDATNYLTSALAALDSNDLMSLEIYATTARHEIDLTEDFLAISERLNSLQAGHYDPNTNIGGGLEKGIEELTSPRARLNSRKMILLLTDGLANIGESGNYSESAGADYALEMAQEAANHGIYVFTVAVGAAADASLMEQIAEIGNGRSFRASGSIEEYSHELGEIFITIGGLKSVQLIQ